MSDWKLTRAGIRALSVDRRRVMCTIEILYILIISTQTKLTQIRKASHTNKVCIGQNLRVELDPHRLSMVSRTRAYKLVRRVLHILASTCKAYTCAQDTLVLSGRELLQEDVLRAPETPRSEDGNLGAFNGT